jgi:hypothetical protein
MRGLSDAAKPLGAASFTIYNNTLGQHSGLCSGISASCVDDLLYLPCIHHELTDMLDFMEYIQLGFAEATNWNRDNSYSSLTATAQCMYR